jgi:hypothetical protein
MPHGLKRGRLAHVIAAGLRPTPGRHITDIGVHKLRVSARLHGDNEAPLREQIVRRTAMIPQQLVDVIPIEWRDINGPFASLKPGGNSARDLSLGRHDDVPAMREDRVEQSRQGVLIDCRVIPDIQIVEDNPRA